MAPTWNKALVRIASAKDPSALPSDENVLFHDDRTITIYDKFAKSQYHFLVLPRIPFKASASGSKAKKQTGTPTLSVANGKLNFGPTSSNNVPPSHMHSISTLLASPYAAEVLDAVRKTSDRVMEHIREDMLKHHGGTWDVERAFHAVPSMEHLHLHVVSMDLVSDRLKHKKHYLSFHPTVDFALRLDAADKLVKEGKKALPKSEHAYEQLLKGPLTSHHTGEGFKYMPDLKAHLDSYWRTHILLSHPRATDSKKPNTKPIRDASDGSPPDQRPSPNRKTDIASLPSRLDDTKQTSSGSEDEEPSLPLK